MKSLPKLTLPQITLASAGLIIVIIALAITLTGACDKEDTPIAPEPTKINTPDSDRGTSARRSPTIPARSTYSRPNPSKSPFMTSKHTCAKIPRRNRWNISTT